MKKLDLDFHSKALVWIGDYPSLIYPAIDVINQDVYTGLSINYGEKRAALEIMLPVGSRVLYGLLGAKFIPNNSGKFSLEVLVSTNSEAVFQQSLAAKLDQVRIGLPSEYSQSVIDGTLHSLDQKSLESLGSGVLRFDKAAHGEIGSSNKFFRKIAATVVQLLMLDKASNEKEVTEIVKTYSLA